MIYIPFKQGPTVANPRQILIFRSDFSGWTNHFRVFLETQIYPTIISLDFQWSLALIQLNHEPLLIIIIEDSTGKVWKIREAQLTTYKRHTGKYGRAQFHRWFHWRSIKLSIVSRTVTQTFDIFGWEKGGRRGSITEKKTQTGRPQWSYSAVAHCYVFSQLSKQGTTMVTMAY